MGCQNDHANPWSLFFYLIEKICSIWTRSEIKISYDNVGIKIFDCGKSLIDGCN